MAVFWAGCPKRIALFCSVLVEIIYICDLYTLLYYHNLKSSIYEKYPFCLVPLGAQHLMAQVELPETGRSKTHKMGNALLFNISYAYHLPAGNLKDRFGNNMSTGLEIDYLMKSNWFVGLGGEYFFGNDVKEDPVVLEMKMD